MMNLVMIVGEILIIVNVDYEKIICDVICEVGYIFVDIGIDVDGCEVIV